MYETWAGHALRWLSSTHSMQCFCDFCWLVGAEGHHDGTTFQAPIHHGTCWQIPYEVHFNSMSFLLNQLTGLREKLQENPTFHGKIDGFLYCRFFLKSTNWLKESTFCVGISQLPGAGRGIPEGSSLIRVDAADTPNNGEHLRGLQVWATWYRPAKSRFTGKDAAQYQLELLESNI